MAEKKVEEVKKEVEEVKKEETVETDEEKDEGGDDEGEKLEPKAHIAKLNAENAKRRANEKALKEENKKLKEDQARKDKALEILTGKKSSGGEDDPLVKAKSDADARQKRLLIRAELGGIAKDAHDPGALFKLFPEKFKDIDVDLESDSVNKDELKEVVTAIRKEAPYLFAGKKAAPPPNPALKPGETNPDGGQPKGGGNHRDQWNALKQAGDKKAAQEYYNKNSKLILAQMSSK